MKIKYLLAILLSAVLLPGCESFLERQPDEPLTTDNIFNKYTTTLDYLVNVYTWTPGELDFSGQTLHTLGSSDECSTVYTGRYFSLYNRNMVSASTYVAANRTYTYDNMYKGIREATYFMQRVHECDELNEVEKDTWHAEARFLRAYYYFLMMRFYGPVFLLYDELVDFKAEGLADVDRATWDECVNWVAAELDEAAEDLPLTQPNMWWGRATKGAAMAVKARLLLYSARPLFNGNSMYEGVVRKDGVALFPKTKDMNKWELAAKASKDIIDMKRYSLVNDPNKDPLTNIHNAFITRGNSEQIYTLERDGYSVRVGATPAGLPGISYGGVSATQKLVDAFAMENGRYPITGYTDNGATPIIDESSGYSEKGSSKFVYPLFKTFNDHDVAVETYMMYQDREPRFYANVYWSGLKWVVGNNIILNNNKEIEFFSNGNSGPKTSNNFPPTGYLGIKFLDTSLNSTNGEWGKISFPLYRYGEVLLNYVEALNEYNPNHPDIYVYWNQIRSRAGVPNIEEVYPEIVGDQELQRHYIRKERQIELCFENLRYFDTRTWMTSDVDDNGPVYGMNTAATDHKAGGNFWKRTQVQIEGGYPGVRIFEDKKYLLPIHRGEGDRVNFTQNYGWE